MAELLQAVKSNILLARGRSALDYRTNQMLQCSMTGVAAALVAQVANSSLQLQYMPTIHWIVPALCTSSLVIGLVCVYFSFLLHYKLAKYICGECLRNAFTQRSRIETDGGNGDGGLESGNWGGERMEEGGGGGREGEGVGGMPKEEGLDKYICGECSRTAVAQRPRIKTDGGNGDGGLKSGNRGGERREQGSGEGREGTGVGGMPRGEGTAGGVEEVGGEMIPSYKATFLLWLPFSLLVLAITLYLLTINLYWFIASSMDLQDSKWRSGKVVFHVLIPLVFQTDDEFLDLCIHRADIGHGYCCSSFRKVRGSTSLSNLQSGVVGLQ